MVLKVIAAIIMLVGIGGMIICVQRRDRMMMALPFFMVSLGITLIGFLTLFLRALLSFYALCTILMLGGLGGMIFSSKRANRPPWAKPLAVVCFVVLMVGAVAILVRSFAPAEHELKMDYALTYARASAQTLGEHLGQAFPGAKALVIVDDHHAQDEHLSVSLEALKKGLGQMVEIVAIASPAPPEQLEQDATMSPEKRLHLRRTAQAEQFDRLLAEHENCNLIITFIGLPRNPADMAVWQVTDAASRPRFALIHSDIRNYRNAIAGGAIGAAVVTRPDYTPEQDKPTRDLRQNFAQRFLLVAPENVAQLAAEHPGLFAP